MYNPICSFCIIFFFFFRHWTSFSVWKLWPSQRHLSISLRSRTQVVQFLTFIWQMSCLTSSHRYFGLPCDLLVRGFHLNIFLTVLVSGILRTWPNQLSLWALIWLTIFLRFISLSHSSLVLILHIWFSFLGPNILRKIFLSKTNNFWIVVSFSTHVLEAYVTIGLMTVLYNFNFELLVTNLLIKNFWLFLHNRKKFSSLPFAFHLYFSLASERYCSALIAEITKKMSVYTRPFGRLHRYEHVNMM